MDCGPRGNLEDPHPATPANELRERPGRRPTGRDAGDGGRRIPAVRRSVGKPVGWEREREVGIDKEGRRRRGIRVTAVGGVVVDVEEGVVGGGGVGVGLVGAVPAEGGLGDYIGGEKFGESLSPVIVFHPFAHFFGGGVDGRRRKGRESGEWLDPSNEVRCMIIWRRGEFGLRRS